VTKGVYPPIGPSYSPEISQIVNRMLAVDAKSRPSCEQILNMKIVQDKIKSLRTEQNNERVYQSAETYISARGEKDELLQTIKVPHNLKHLSSRLPKSNYVKKREENRNDVSKNATT
jgi:serine/threonine protein kinase